MITAKNIHKYYGDLEVLKGIDLEIQKGESSNDQSDAKF